MPNTTTMKPGQYVYYLAPDGGTIPARITKLHRTTATINGDFAEGRKTRRVKLSKIVDQMEWNQ